MIRKLGDVCEIIMGQSPDGSSYNRTGVGLPLLNGPSEFGSRHPVVVQWTSEPTKICKDGDILLCVRGNTVGRRNVADGEYCIGRGLAAIRPVAGIAHDDFVWFALGLITEQLLSKSSGSTFPNLNGEQLTKVEISCPDLPTQRRIASRLKKQMATLEQARHSTSEAFKAHRPLFEKTLSENFHGITPLSVGRDEAPAPEGWRWQSLLDLARLATGHTPSRRCPEYWADGDIPWLALPDIRALDCRVATETSEKTNALGIANSSARVLPPGTVALSRTASVGFVTIFGCEMATSQDFVNWVCGPSLHAPFLLWLLRASRAFIKGVSTGAVHQTVYMDVVERFRVCLPDLPTQQKIAARLDEAFRLIQQLQSAHEAQLEALDKLPGAYLREAFGSLTD